MKISEIEEIMLQGRFSEKLFLEYQSALKRVPKNLRCQHCYTTAFGFRDRDPENAIRLIRYGLDTFEHDWADEMRAYHNLGSIYEGCGQYQQAKEAFQSALSAIPEDRREDYVPNLSMYILRAELHCSDFEYTEYAGQLYQSVCSADSFSASFRHFVFYRAVMEIILAVKNNDSDAQKAAYSTAMLALDGEQVTGLDRLLRRHRYKDDAHATDAAISFLKRCRI